MTYAQWTFGLALLAGAAASSADAAPPPACEARSPMQRRLEYPSVELSADQRLTFRLCAPASTAVKVTSSELADVPTGFDGKPAGLPMTKDAQGYWSATTPHPVAAGNYRFAFNIDGVDLPDPQGVQFSRDFRGVRSVVEVPGTATAFQAYRADVPHGVVSTIDYPSSTLGAVRRAHVYTPPGYEGPGDRRYPVLYLVHGAGDSDDSWTSAGHANYILDNLIAAGQAKPMIIVMPFGHTPDRAGVDRMVNTDFGSDLISDLIPYVDTHFRTRAKPVDRAMAGLSMGGAHTLNFGLPHPEIFGSIGVFSIGLTAGEPAAAYVARNDAALKQRAAAHSLVFYAFGKDDFLFAMAAPTRKILDDYKIAYSYRESDGGHTWVNWRVYLNEFAPLLFR